MSVDAAAEDPSHARSSAATPDRPGSPTTRRPRARRVGSHLAGRSCTTANTSANSTAVRPGRAEASRAGTSPRSVDPPSGPAIGQSGPTCACCLRPRSPRPARATPATTPPGTPPNTSCRSSRRPTSGRTAPGGPGAARATLRRRPRLSHACRSVGPIWASAPAAPRCGGPAGPSASHSRRSQRGGPPGVGPFFDARPLELEPRGDLLRVALPGDSLGLLRGEATGPHPGAEILRVEADAELLSDQFGEAWSGPQLGSEPMLRRVLGQPASDDLLLRRRELGRAARYRS